jgi:uncharacterized protein
MRRKDKEIKDISELEEIISKAEICHIAFCYEDNPYIIPANFGYRENCLYIHSAPEGQKIDMLLKNNRVCFSVECDYRLLTTTTACNWSLRYRSVIGFGRAFVIEGSEQKVKALDIIMAHYSEGQFEYSKDNLDKLAIIKIEIESMTGKKSGWSVQ